MRFDDRLATALGQPAEGAAARQVIWRQLVDLLGDPADDEYLREAAFERLREWRIDVPIAARQNAAMLLLSRPSVAADLVEFFASDATVVFAPLLAGVDFRGKVWRRLIPRLSPVARAILRHRRDLPNGAIRALEAFGSVDLVIEGPAAPIEPDRSAYTAPDIRELRARIDAFREANAEAPAVQETEFTFETDAQGVITWCDAATRGAIIGLSIADAAPGQAHGVDGHAAGAFRARAPFRDARLTIARAGPVAGAWAISGASQFDPVSGRFTGYRGSARRPHVGERAESDRLLGSTLSGDSLRQLAHEIRTPLNAIAGFAEMIERQMLGPAPAPYRQRAAQILTETQQLDAVLNELQEAAQFETQIHNPPPEQIDCAQLLARIGASLEPLARSRNVQVTVAVAADCGRVLLDRTSAERMITRLLSAAIGLASSGDRIGIEVAVSGSAPHVQVAISRPRLVASFSEQALLDACDIDGEEPEAPPVLGLGFTLRLVRRFAESKGGRLDLGPDMFVLSLPAIDVGRSGNEAAACQQD